MNTVKWNLDRPTLIHFNDWLKEKAEAHERMKATSSKSRTEEVPANNTVTKTKTRTKVFAATTSNQVKTVPKVGSGKQCIACKDSHPLWRCSVFSQKTPTERTKLATESKLCFSCLNDGHSFRQCPQPTKCTKKAVVARITLYCTALIESSPRKVSAIQKLPEVVKQSQSETNRL